MKTKRGIFGRGNHSSFSSCSRKNFPEGKKAQITIFIIIGILILFAFAGILYITKTTIKETITAEGEPVITAVPQEFQPVQAYTENCLYQQGKKGLLILGQQAGYIYPELVGKYSSSDPTGADGLDLEPIKVPYWHYNLEPNSGNKVVFASLKPKLQAKEDSEMSIEAQLSRFVKEKIDGCLLDYSAFKNQGFSFELPGTKEVEVKVGEETINFWLRMPIKAKKGQAEQSMDGFYVKIPLSLKHYFEVASRIKEAEQNQHFLETQGLELIAVYSKKDMKYFPPTSDVSYELFSPYYWNEIDLKEKFVQLLSSYVPMLHYLGSSNFYYHIFPDSNRLAQKVSDNMVLPLLGAEDLEVRFDYFGWEPYFKTNSENGIIKPEHLFVNYEILSFGTQRYETHYDASYPVLVSLKDNSALNNEGYTFVFALESNIRNNEAAKADVVREIYPKKTASLACKEEQKNTGLLKTVVVDSFTKEPIEMVKIGFTIPEQEECEMGFTDDKGALESKYPAVYGGVINFIQPEYLTAFYPIDTYKYKEKPALIGYASEKAEPEKAIELDRIVTKNITVKKKELKKCLEPLVCEYTYSGLIPGLQGLSLLPYKDISCKKGSRQCFFGTELGFLGPPVISLEANGSLSRLNDYYLTGQEKFLGPDEEAILTLKRVSGFRQELRGSDFFRSISVQGNQEAEIELVPGLYEASLILLTKKEVSIPAERRCLGYSIISWEKEECFTFNQSKMDKYVSGSLKWDSPKTYLAITPEELYNSREITFYVLSQDIYSVPESTETVSKKCSGWVCIPGLGCAGEACVDEKVKIAGKVVEDLQVPGLIANISSSPEIREILKPGFS